MDRFLAFDKIHNFRDFGGYPAEGGRRVRRGRLYRSAHLARATAEDQARLRDLGVEVAADLRRPGERASEPSAWPQDRTPRIVTSDLGQTEDLPPHLRFLRDTEHLTEELTRGYMLATYERLAYDDRHVEVFQHVFRALAAGEGPLLVHCAAGKDRTGVLCALIQSALGVSRADVAADYLMSNRTDVTEAILAQTAERFERRVARTIDPEVLRPMVGVHEAYLGATFDAIERRSGSLEQYVRTTLDVGDGELAGMRAHLTEGSDHSV